MLIHNFGKGTEQMPVNSGTLAAIPGKNNVQISDIRVGGKMTLILR
jgi:hypothetical protein